MTGPWYPAPFSSTGDPLEDEGEWYGESADETYARPIYTPRSFVPETVEVDIMPDTGRLSAALAAAARYERLPAEVKYTAHLRAKLEELKAREELERELAPATPWPSIVDAIAEAAAKAFEPYIEAWRQIAKAAADAVKYVLTIPGVSKAIDAELDAKAEAEAIRTGARYWTDRAGRPRRNPTRRPILHKGKANRHGR